MVAATRFVYQIGFLVFIIIINLSAGAVGVNSKVMFNKKNNSKNTIIWKGEEESLIKRGLDAICLALVRLFNIIFITNPLLFPIWAFLFPWGSGDFLSTGGFWKTSIGFRMKKITTWEGEHLLPLGRKLKFIEGIEPHQTSVQSQLQYFRYLRAGGLKWKLAMFSRDGMYAIWNDYHVYPDVQKQALKEGLTLSDKEIFILIKEGRFSFLEEYSKNRTLSVSILSELYLYEDGKKIFFNQIAKSGATNDILSLVKEEDANSLKEALKEFSQVALVRATEKEHDEKTFFTLAQKEELCLRAQKELSLWQYQTMQILCKRLLPEVILLKANPAKNTDWQTWIKMFIERERLTFPEWEYFVLNTPEVRVFIMNNPPAQIGRI